MFDTVFRQFVLDHALAKVQEESTPEQGMQSAIDVYSCGAVKVRVVSDRGQRFLDLWLPAQRSWKDVFSVVKMIDPVFEPKTGSFAESIRIAGQYWERMPEALKRRG